MPLSFMGSGMFLTLSVMQLCSVVKICYTANRTYLALSLFGRVPVIRMKDSWKPPLQYEIRSMLRRLYTYTLHTENAQG